MPYLTYTPETYYIQFTVIGGDNQIFVSPTIEGTTDLAAMNVEYKFVLKGLDNGTTYVANIVANNTYGGQVSEDIFFTTNPFGEDVCTAMFFFNTQTSLLLIMHQSTGRP